MNAYRNRPIHLSRSVMVSQNWITQGVEKARPNNRWFKHITNDCVKQLKKGIDTYCFSLEQVEHIKSKTPKIRMVCSYVKEDGIYYLLYKGLKR